VIAFLGMGLLGSNFVRALVRRGERVQVWNRSTARASAVAAETGASAFEDPAAAVRGAASVHLTLSDDAAVDDVLERASSGLAPGVPVVDHTTTSPGGAEDRARRWSGRGVPFLHAPVFMGPQQALEAQGLMLASGDRAVFDRLEPELARMTGKLVYVGAPLRLAAAYKLLGNHFLVTMTAGLRDTLALGKGMGLGPADAEALFAVFNPAATLGQRLKRLIVAGRGPPSWALGMARKDARLMLEAAAAGGAELGLLPVVTAMMDRWMARGHAAEDWTVIARDVTE
jgi:3-hydroxyisobutyrate dehydrogenase